MLRPRDVGILNGDLGTLQYRASGIGDDAGKRSERSAQRHRAQKAPAGRIVIDKTGQNARGFPHTSKWTAQSRSGTAGGGSLFPGTLGSKVAAATDPLEVLVIDHIERPTTGFYAEALSRSSL